MGYAIIHIDKTNKEVELSRKKRKSSTYSGLWHLANTPIYRVGISARELVKLLRKQKEHFTISRYQKKVLICWGEQLGMEKLFK